MWPGIPDSYQKLPESDSGSFRYTRSRDYQTPTRHALLGSGRCWKTNLLSSVLRRCCRSILSTLLSILSISRLCGFVWRPSRTAVWPAGTRKTVVTTIVSVYVCVVLMFGLWLYVYILMYCSIVCLGINSSNGTTATVVLQTLYGC